MQPLADRIRPSSLDDFFGQEHLIEKGKLLYEKIMQDDLHSMIFWGPPGTGKTTLAKIISSFTKREFIWFSATFTSIKEVREVMQKAKESKKSSIVFIDEIHRFNKSQQDAFLPFVEDGSIVMIGATTENPSFEVISPLLSRSRVYVFHELSEEALIKILTRALEKLGINSSNKEWLSEIVKYAAGDARFALTTLEIILSMTDVEKEFNRELLQEVLQKALLRYDKDGEEHYNIISALHKSMRNSDVDASLYWLARMLESGEDPKYIVRRLIRFASEDIGNADPQALILAVSAKEAVHFIGMPESDNALAQLVIYLALAPKSNSVYTSYKRVQGDIKKGEIYPVPLQIRNAPTKLMKELDYGKGYKYAHNYEETTTAMECMPEELRNRQYYIPKEVGFEREMKKRMEYFKKLKLSLKNK